MGRPSDGWSGFGSNFASDFLGSVYMRPSDAKSDRPTFKMCGFNRTVSVHTGGASVGATDRVNTILVTTANTYT